MLVVFTVQNTIRLYREERILHERRRLPRCENNVPPSTLMRWCKFNLVGGIGIAVQFAASSC